MQKRLICVFMSVWKCYKCLVVILIPEPMGSVFPGWGDLDRVPELNGYTWDRKQRVSKWRDSVKWEANQELYPHFQIIGFSGAVSAQCYKLYALEKF